MNLSGPAQTQALWPPPSNAPSPYQFYVRASDFEVLTLSQDKKLEPQNQAQWSEKLIAHLFQLSGWTILHKRFRIRSSEIDLVVLDSRTKQGRLIEVKSRRYRGSLELSSVEAMLPPTKRKSLRTGAKTLAGKHWDIDSWSLDLILITPDHASGKHLITTWVNALELN